MKFKALIVSVFTFALALLAFLPDASAQGYNLSGPTYTYLINGTSNFLSVGSTVSVSPSSPPSIVLQKGKDLLMTLPNVTAVAAGATPRWEYNWLVTVDNIHWFDGAMNFTNVSVGPTAQYPIWKVAVTGPTNNNHMTYLDLTNLYAIKLKTVTNRDQSRDGFASNITYRFGP